MRFGLEEVAQRTSAAFTFFAEAERVLDRGVCSDDCLDCAKLIVADAMIALFDEHVFDAGSAVKILRGHDVMCPKCAAYEKTITRCGVDDCRIVVRGPSDSYRLVCPRHKPK
jgi:hypothetical protein